MLIFMSLIYFFQPFSRLYFIIDVCLHVLLEPITSRLCVDDSSCSNLLQAEWMAPEVLRNEPSDEKYANLFSTLCSTSFYVHFLLKVA